jgi:RHS repeat-associated protein
MTRRYDNGETRGSLNISSQYISVQNYYYFKDHLGTVQDVMTDRSGANSFYADGQVVSYTYDEWGARTRAINYVAGFNLTSGYTGHLYDSDAQLVFAPHRVYDPSMGRWISIDPIGESGGENLYAYVGNNPLRWTDPFGLTAECPMTCPDNDPGWKPYVGKPEVFHCGFNGYLENRTPTSDDPTAECFYDPAGNLVTPLHPYRGCRGTPDQYPAWDPRHFWPDSGGIWAFGREGYEESQRYYRDHPQ